MNRADEATRVLDRRKLITAISRACNRCNKAIRPMKLEHRCGSDGCGEVICDDCSSWAIHSAVNGRALCEQHTAEWFEDPDAEPMPSWAQGEGEVTNG